MRIAWSDFLVNHPRPIIVTGTRRSGATLMCRTLAAHPTIYIKNEIQDAGKASTEAFVAHLSQQVASTDIGNPLSAYMAKAEKTRWGLKDPHLTFCLPELAGKLPTAKVIVMFRDARAVSLSYMEQRWRTAANWYAGAQRWIEGLKLQETFLSAHPSRALQVRDLQPTWQTSVLFTSGQKTRYTNENMSSNMGAFRCGCRGGGGTTSTWSNW